MFEARCPICSKRFEVERVEDQPAFPFCSDRCKLVDLGRWLGGSYVIPGKPGSASGAEAGGEGAIDPDGDDEGT
jgi:endogenous inhibitor of DNA gyrase (YacG/DUF329 family)